MTLADHTNPLKLNTLQLKTMALLQAMAQESNLAQPADEKGDVLLTAMPHAHGDHFHIGHRLVMARDATSLENPNVFQALARKGLVAQADNGAPIVTAAGIAYPTGIEAEILRGGHH